MMTCSKLKTMSDVVAFSGWLPSDRAIQWMIDRGMEAAPEEICGLRVARMIEGQSKVRVFQLRNTAEEPCFTYAFNTATLKRLFLAGEFTRTDKVSFWHTHPGGREGPSSEDLQSKVSGVDYLVVTIPNGKVEWF